LACTNRNTKNRNKNWESRFRLTTAHVNLGDKNTHSSATKNPSAKPSLVAQPALKIGAQRTSLNSEPRTQPSNGADGESREQLLPTEEDSARETAGSKKNQREHWPLARRLKRTKSKNRHRRLGEKSQGRQRPWATQGAMRARLPSVSAETHWEQKDSTRIQEPKEQSKSVAGFGTETRPASSRQSTPGRAARELHRSGDPAAAAAGRTKKKATGAALGTLAEEEQLGKWRRKAACFSSKTESAHGGAYG
jgi:hypothetical protein